MKLSTILVLLISGCVCFSFTREQHVNNNEEVFETIFAWSHINFTWQSESEYSAAVREARYIPQNVVPGGIKLYEEYVYINVPKFRRGVPVTLTRVHQNKARSENVPLDPYPNWEFNDDRQCENLQSILGMEIDTRGILWLLDGVRINNNNIECPTKLVLLDLKNNGRIVDYHEFPDDICLQNGGFLNDIVIDETDGGFAYITDNSVIDPGLIVYSKYQKRAWKLRDSSMFSDRRAANYVVENNVISRIFTIDGLALSPNLPHGRMCYYTTLSGLDVYGISNNILKDEELCRLDRWRRNVTFVGEKEAQSDGMIMDSQGNLYYTLMALYGVGRWNMFKSFETSEIIYSNRDTFIWTDGFGMDQKGYLYLITNEAYKFFQLEYTLYLTPEIKFRIHRMFTGTKSYLYNEIND